MLNFSEINGKEKESYTKKKLETSPFSFISSPSNHNFSQLENIFLVRETTTHMVKVHLNNEIIDVEDDTFTSKITLRSETDIDFYKKKGEFPDKTPMIYYISEADLHQIYKQGFFNSHSDAFPITKFNPDIVDGQKYCLVQFIDNNNHIILQTEDNRFFMEPFFIPEAFTTSSLWNLKPLFQHISKNKQFLFFISQNNNTILADVNNSKDLPLIIREYYSNENEKDIEQFKCAYIFNNDEIKLIISNGKDWIKKIYQFQDEHLSHFDFNNLFHNEDLQLIAIAGSGYQFYKQYQLLLDERTSLKKSIKNCFFYFL